MPDRQTRGGRRRRTGLARMRGPSMEGRRPWPATVRLLQERERLANPPILNRARARDRSAAKASGGRCRDTEKERPQSNQRSGVSRGTFRDVWRRPGTASHSIITSQSGAEPAFMRVLCRQSLALAPSVAPLATLPLNGTSPGQRLRCSCQRSGLPAGPAHSRENWKDSSRWCRIDSR
jgi:hypothetical protein